MSRALILMAMAMCTGLLACTSSSPEGQDSPPEVCDPGDGEQCGEGVPTCTMGGDECPEGSSCQTGCCQPLITPK